jgi:hypothetical protein
LVDAAAAPGAAFALAASIASIFSAVAMSPVFTALKPLARIVSFDALSATGCTFHSSVSMM